LLMSCDGAHFGKLQYPNVLSVPDLARGYCHLHHIVCA
jgi:hypothetical protein